MGSVSADVGPSANVLSGIDFWAKSRLSMIPARAPVQKQTLQNRYSQRKEVNDYFAKEFATTACCSQALGHLQAATRPLYKTNACLANLHFKTFYFKDFKLFFLIP